MNSALAGLFRGVQGSASAYGKQKEDQRMYELDEKKAKQAAMRQEHFAKYNYGFQDSGMRGKDGRVINNNQYAAGGEFESALSQKAKITEQARVDAEGRASKKNASLLEEKRLYTEQQQLDKEERADDRLNKRQGEASKTSIKSKFRSLETTSKKDIETPEEGYIETLKLADTFKGEKAVESLPQVIEAKMALKGAQMLSEMQEQGLTPKQMTAALTHEYKSITNNKPDLKAIFDLALYQGLIEPSGMDLGWFGTWGRGKMKPTK